MITVTYYNEDTEQEMTIEMEMTSKTTASISMEFEPSASNTTQDPGGIMKKLMDVFK